MLKNYVLDGTEYKINSEVADDTVDKECTKNDTTVNEQENTLINNKVEEQSSKSNVAIDIDLDLEDEINKYIAELPCTILDILKTDRLTSEQSTVLRNWLLESYADVIVDELNYEDKSIENTERSKFKHAIELKKGASLNTRKALLYYKTEVLKRIVEEKIEQLLRLGIIRKSNSNHSSPIMLIHRNGKWRIVHDFRELNKVTERDIYPFAPADQTVNLCKNSNIFTKFDMLMGYFQIEMDQESIPLTAFTTHIGKYEYLRMPQGLVNAPSTFARMMSDVFGRIKNLLQYFDDLLIHNKDDVAEHFKSVVRVLLLCRKNVIFISKEKAEIFKDEIEFLGFNISKDGLSPRKAKVKAILEIPRPRNGEEGLAFLGVIGYYRRCIDDFATKTLNLTKECRKENKKPLSAEAIHEFEALKKEFEDDKIVAIPIEQDNSIVVDIDKLRKSTDLPISSKLNLWEGAYHLFCDASNLAISGVLYQVQNSELKPIWFHSRKLNAAQRNYSVGDRELLAIYDSLHKFKHLLYTKNVAVYTDHANLKYILKKGELTMRQMNHIRYLEEFKMELLDIPGEANRVADLLSRKYDNIQWDHSFLEKIRLQQMNSEWLKELQKNKNITITDYHGIKYLVEDGYSKLIITDKETIDVILHEYHDTLYGGHRGFDITFDQIRRDYYFREMGPIIMKYIKSCMICQSNIVHKKTGFLQSLDIPDEVWRDWSMDFITLPASKVNVQGFEHIANQVLVVVCRLSKMVRLIPCSKNITSEQTAQILLDNVFKLHGFPRSIVSDRDPRFIAEIFKKWADTMKSTLKMTVAHRPQGDGQTERINRELKRILTKFADEFGENWSSVIGLVEFCLNSSMNKTTKFSPFQIVYGFNPATPANHFNVRTNTIIKIDDIRKMIRDNIIESQLMNQKYYNAKRTAKVKYEEGDKVMVKREAFQENQTAGDLLSHKLLSKNIGPFKVIGVKDNNVKLDLGYQYRNKHNVFNIDQVIKIYENDNWKRDGNVMPGPVGEDDYYRIKKIIQHDQNGNYLVQWEGYENLAQWIHKENITEDAVNRYHLERGDGIHLNSRIDKNRDDTVDGDVATNPNTGEVTKNNASNIKNTNKTLQSSTDSKLITSKDRNNTVKSSSNTGLTGIRTGSNTNTTSTQTNSNKITGIQTDKNRITGIQASSINSSRDRQVSNNSSSIGTSTLSKNNLGFNDKYMNINKDSQNKSMFAPVPTPSQASKLSKQPTTTTTTRVAKSNINTQVSTTSTVPDYKKKTYFKKRNTRFSNYRIEDK